MKSIPKSARTWRALRYARKFIQQANLTRLPVDPYKLYEQFDWLLFSLSHAEKLYGKKDPLDLRKNEAEAVTIWNGEQYLTIYDDSTNYTPRRIRWTLAHEIGHIILHHHLDFDLPTIQRGGVTHNLTKEQYGVLEKEAQYFAKELLAPVYVLKAIGIVHKRDISRICSISDDAASYTEIDIQYHSNKEIYIECTDFYQSQYREFLNVICVCTNHQRKLPKSHLLNRTEVKNVSNKWHKLIENNGKFDHCPQCDQTDFAPDVVFCMICGLSLLNTCSNIEEIEVTAPCGAINPVNARYCQYCGSKTQIFQKGLLTTWEELREFENNKNKTFEISEADLPF